MRFVQSVGVVLATILSLSAQQSSKSSTIPAPPFMNGGVAGLWYREHEFVKKQYGDFELLNFSNVDYRVQKDGVTDTTWKLVALGNFLNDDLQYATLARIKDRPNAGVMLIMFEWVDPSDTSLAQGVFYHAFIGKQAMLLRTKQAAEGTIDTLEFSCADTKRRCGKCYLDTKANQVVLSVTDKD